MLPYVTLQGHHSKVKCLKSDGIAPEAREAIAEQTKALSSAAEIEQDNDDPFSEDERN